MSKKYDEYIIQHRENVQKAFQWIEENIPEVFPDECTKIACLNQVNMHDESKYNSDEYNAYDAYFYSKNRSYEVVQNFNKAWLLHIHRNPHHWQYWILINDNPDEGEIILDMPDNYIIEMICDWWSFSFGKGNLEEIFDWYTEHKQYMKLSDKTRNKVEDILDKIRTKLEEIGSNEEN